MAINAQEMDRRAVRRRMLESLDEEVHISHAAGIKGLGGGLTRGRIRVEGDVGDYFGILNAGAHLVATGSAGRFAADNMTAGTVVIAGDAGDGAGEYCCGGTLLIRGSAGDFLGTMNKGGTIVVGGNAGSSVGTYMSAGDIVILGDAGDDAGNYIIRGSIYVLGSWKSLGSNAKEESIRASDAARLASLIRLMGVEKDPRDFRKIVPLSSKPFYQERQPVRMEARL